MSQFAEDTAELQKLRDQYPLGTLQLETTQGRRWKRRLDESDAYFTRYSKNWNSNRALLCDFTKMIDEFGTYVALAYPIIANFNADMYFRNPRPLIQDKRGNKDLGKILTDVITSVHQECDSEREMRDALQDQSWASFGVVGVSFMQKPYNAGDQIEGAPGEIVEPTEQRVIVQRISPWKIRWDPHGRRWDLSDHRYFAYDSYEYLGPLMRDPELSDDDRKRLIAYYGRGGGDAFEDSDNTESSIVGKRETDQEFIRVCMRTIWSRPDHMIYRMPRGASFTFTPKPWDPEWANADMFPIRYMPRNRIPEDQKNTEGFIAMADLTLIKPHIENINKMQGLLVRGLEHVIDVYVTWKGVVSSMAMQKIAGTDRMFQIVQVDPDELKKYPELQVEGPRKLDDLITLLETGDTKDLQHMAAIDHELAMIQQIIGQGPADRGGASDSNTATEAYVQNAGRQARAQVNRADAGKHYNALTKMIFIIIQARHTLSIRYQATTAFKEKVWREFSNPVGQLKNIDLHFEYATGSSEARTTEQEFSLRERAAQILMPMLTAKQDWPKAMKLAADLIEPLQIIGSEAYTDDTVNQIVKQLLLILRGLGKGQIGDMELTADNVAVVSQIPELIAALAQAVLTPDELAEVEGMVSGAQMPEDMGGGMGSLPSAQSAGEMAMAEGGAAAAGRVGGLQSAR